MVQYSPDASCTVTISLQTSIFFQIGRTIADISLFLFSAARGTQNCPRLKAPLQVPRLLSRAASARTMLTTMQPLPSLIPTTLSANEDIFISVYRRECSKSFACLDQPQVSREGYKSGTWASLYFLLYTLFIPYYHLTHDFSYFLSSSSLLQSFSWTVSVVGYARYLDLKSRLASIPNFNHIDAQNIGSTPPKMSTQWDAANKRLVCFATRILICQVPSLTTT